MEFQGWPKTPRLYRDVVITEKLDGTNAAVIVEPIASLDDAEDVDNAVAVVLRPSPEAPGSLQAFKVGAQSRNRLITPEADNYGFAAWVFENAPELVDFLGPGRHFGEWYGAGIQRGYGLADKRFALFNVKRFENAAEESNGLVECVPVLWRGVFCDESVEEALDLLRDGGSYAAPGFMRPEGIVVFHVAAGQVFKVLLENDALPKSAAVELRAVA